MIPISPVNFFVIHEVAYRILVIVSSTIYATHKFC